MTETKTQDGGWLHENDEGNLDRWLIIDPHSTNRDVVAEIPKTGDEEYDNEIVFPRAVLLAAAPELLEALRAMVVSVEYWNENRTDFEGFGAAFDQSIAAIAKATGGEA